MEDGGIPYATLADLAERQTAHEYRKQLKSLFQTIATHCRASSNSQPPMTFETREQELNYLLFPFHVSLVMGKGKVSDVLLELLQLAFSGAWLPSTCVFEPPAVELPKETSSVLTRWFKGQPAAVDVSSKASYLRDVLVLDFLDVLISQPSGMDFTSLANCFKSVMIGSSQGPLGVHGAVLSKCFLYLQRFAVSNARFREAQSTVLLRIAALAVDADGLTVFNETLTFFCSTDDQEDCPAALPSAEEETLQASGLSALLTILVNSGPEVRRSDLILSTVRTIVMPWLMQRATSPIYDTYRLSFSAFLVVHRHFAQHLVSEVSAFLDVTFGIMEGKSLVQRKMIAVEAISKIAEEPRNLIELFLNNDCVKGRLNVYERMICQLRGLYLASRDEPAPISPERSHKRSVSQSGGVTPEEANDILPLRILTLNTLLQISESHRQWVERFEDAADAQFHQEDETPVEEQSFVKEHNEKQHVRSLLATFNRGQPMDAVEHIEVVPQEHTDENCINFDHRGAKCTHPEDCIRAHSVAKFFRAHEDTLDKLVLGEFFSGLRKRLFVKLVLTAWIRTYDFTDQPIDVSLRLFLGGFKVLGEAQIIDSTMELFAEAYCTQNPDSVFKNAGAAFVLSFSICMLNTDLHSRHIKDKERMQKAGFSRNNRGINDGEDLPEGFLDEVYDRIQQEEIVLRPTPNLSTQPSPTADLKQKNSSSFLSEIPILRHITPMASAVTGVVLAPVDLASSHLFGKSRLEAQSLQSRSMDLQAALQRALSILATDAGSSDQRVFTSGTELQHAIPMWGITTNHCVAVFGAALTSNDDDEFLMGLEGIQHTVRISGRYGCMQEIEPLLHLLFDCTQLKTLVDEQTGHLQRALNKRSVACLSAMFRCYIANGESIGEKLWEYPFIATSLLELSGLLVKSSEDTKPKPTEDQKQSKAWRFASTKSPQPQEPQSMNAKLQTESRNIIDLYLQNGKDLRSLATQCLDVSNMYPARQYEVVKALCHVAKHELKRDRTCSMTQLVEMLTILMPTATRLVWHDVWAKASSVYVEAGTSTCEDVAKSAVDSLAHLAALFLERVERVHFADQKDVLRPFELILLRNSAVNVRTHLLLALQHLVAFRAESISSGWLSLLSGLSHTALFPDVVQHGWDLTDSIIRSHLPTVAASLDGTLPALLTTVASFACATADTNISTQALSAVLYLASVVQCGLLATNDESSDAAANKTEYDVLATSNRNRSEGKEPLKVSDTIWIKFVDTVSLTALNSQRPMPLRVRALATMFFLTVDFGLSFEGTLKLLTDSCISVVNSLLPRSDAMDADAVGLWSLGMRCLVATCATLVARHPTTDSSHHISAVFESILLPALSATRLSGRGLLVFLCWVEAASVVFSCFSSTTGQSAISLTTGTLFDNSPCVHRLATLLPPTVRRCCFVTQVREGGTSTSNIPQPEESKMIDEDDTLPVEFEKLVAQISKVQEMIPAGSSPSEIQRECTCHLQLSRLLGSIAAKVEPHNSPAAASARDRFLACVGGGGGTETQDERRPSPQHPLFPAAMSLLYINFVSHATDCEFVVTAVEGLCESYVKCFNAVPTAAVASMFQPPHTMSFASPFMMPPPPTSPVVTEVAPTTPLLSPATSESFSTAAASPSSKTIPPASQYLVMTTVVHAVCALLERPDTQKDVKGNPSLQSRVLRCLLVLCRHVPSSFDEQMFGNTLDGALALLLPFEELKPYYQRHPSGAPVIVRLTALVQTLVCDVQ